MTVRYGQFQGTGETVPGNEDRSHWLPFARRSQVNREQFEFWHLPLRWHHKPGVGWLPDLARVSWTPGGNGIQGDTTKPGTARDMTAARIGLTKKGGVPIPRGAPTPGGDYVRRHRTTTGLYHHTDPFEGFTVVGGRLRTHQDEEGRTAWLLSLVEAGVVGTMPEDVLNDKLETLQGRIATYESQHLPGDYKDRKIKAAQAQIDAMKADWQRQFGSDEVPTFTPETTPAPKKRTRKKAT